MTACANKSESPETERLQIPAAPATPAPDRLPIPPLPPAPTDTSRLQIPDPTLESPVKQPSIAQAEANAAPATTPSDLSTDPLLANQDSEAGSTAIPEVTKPPIQAPLASTASSESIAPADRPTVATTNIRERSEQTDDISVITWRAERGHIESQLMLGKAYAAGTLVEKDIEQARLWLELASMQGCLLYTSPSPRD